MRAAVQPLGHQAPRALVPLAPAAAPRPASWYYRLYTAPKLHQYQASRSPLRQQVGPLPLCTCEPPVGQPGSLIKYTRLPCIAGPAAAAPATCQQRRRRPAACRRRPRCRGAQPGGHAAVPLVAAGRRGAGAAHAGGRRLLGRLVPHRGDHQGAGGGGERGAFRLAGWLAAGGQARLAAGSQLAAVWAALVGCLASSIGAERCR